MNDIEKRARELVAAQYQQGRARERRLLLDPEVPLHHFGYANQRAIRAIIAALTPPEGYVLVQESILGPLLRDAITSVEFIAGRAQSKPLSRRISDRAWKLIEACPARPKVSP